MASFDLHDPSTYQVAKHNIPTNFSYTVTAEYVDTLTGSIAHQQSIQIKNDAILGIDQIMDTADNVMKQIDYPYADDVASGALRLDLTVTKAFINPNIAV